MGGRGNRPAVARAWTFEATVDAPGSARAAVREFVTSAAAAALDGVDVMLLCVSEAVTNAVLHAYPDPGVGGAVELEAALFESHVDLTVRDRGQGLSPRADSPGFGIGLPLISQLCSEVQVRTPPAGGTEMTMRFERQGGP